MFGRFGNYSYFCNRLDNLVFKIKLKLTMVIKRAITLHFLLLCLIATIWADTGKSLIVESVSGKKVSFLLVNSPELTFNDRTLYVQDNTQTKSIKIDNVFQYYFISEGTDISSVESKADIRLYYDTDGNVVVEGFGKPAQIRLYSVNGLDYTDCVSVINDKAVVSLSSLQKGVYIISINNQQIKVYKK